MTSVFIFRIKGGAGHEKCLKKTASGITGRVQERWILDDRHQHQKNGRIISAFAGKLTPAQIAFLATPVTDMDLTDKTKRRLLGGTGDCVEDGLDYMSVTHGWHMAGLKYLTSSVPYLGASYKKILGVMERAGFYHQHAGMLAEDLSTHRSMFLRLPDESARRTFIHGLYTDGVDPNMLPKTTGEEKMTHNTDRREDLFPGARTFTEQQVAFLAMPIEDMELTLRTGNILRDGTNNDGNLMPELRNMPITHGLQMMALNKEEFLSVPFIGPKALNEIKEVMMHLGGFNPETETGVTRDVVISARPTLDTLQTSEERGEFIRGIFAPQSRLFVPQVARAEEVGDAPRVGVNEVEGQGYAVYLPVNLPPKYRGLLTPQFMKDAVFAEDAEIAEKMQPVAKQAIADYATRIASEAGATISPRDEDLPLIDRENNYVLRVAVGSEVMDGLTPQFLVNAMSTRAVYDAAAEVVATAVNNRLLGDKADPSTRTIGRDAGPGVNQG